MEEKEGENKGIKFDATFGRMLKRSVCPSRFSIDLKI